VDHPPLPQRVDAQGGDADHEVIRRPGPAEEAFDQIEARVGGQGAG
jgi:hypothetical protein